MECSSLFRDGYFFACISLTQAVAEALSRFLCARLSIESDEYHVARVKRLLTAKAISGEVASHFSLIQECRNDFHHLNPAAPSGRQELQEMALRKLEAWAAVEAEIFAYSVRDGSLVVNDLRLWDAT